KAGSHLFLMTRSQVSTKSLPILTNAARGSGLQRKTVTPPVSVAIPQATQYDPVPGVRRRPSSSSSQSTPPDPLPLMAAAVPLDPPPMMAAAVPPGVPQLMAAAMPLDPPVPVMEETTPQAPMPHARPAPMPRARPVPVVAP
ncbi:hypothetical protein P4O66_010147, partial [Electrophorus voltai]